MPWPRRATRLRPAGTLPGLQRNAHWTSRARCLVVERIRDDVSAVLRDGVSTKIRDAGFEPAEVGPEGFAQMLGEEITVWARVLDAAGIKPE